MLKAFRWLGPSSLVKAHGQTTARRLFRDSAGAAHVGPLKACTLPGSGKNFYVPSRPCSKTAYDESRTLQELDLNALSIQDSITAMKQTLLHGLFPAVRAEVLRLLFMSRGQELYTRELARLRGSVDD
jgi:hypothetical protein